MVAFAAVNSATFTFPCSSQRAALSYPSSARAEQYSGSVGLVGGSKAGLGHPLRSKAMER